MRTLKCLITATFCLFILSCSRSSDSVIRINQLGYRPGDIKTAVFLSRDETGPRRFRLIDAGTGITVYESDSIISAPDMEPFSTCLRLPFTAFEKEGRYMIAAGGVRSPEFRIAADVYDGSADFLLTYMRQQRCGFNPYLKDSCHTHDGYVMYGPGNDSAHIDATGGWHDAADYLQYVATSANATYQMLFALGENPGAFGDTHDADGLPGSDGKPDILNEINWGLDWLLKMNPGPREMYNQIADDRDHVGFRYPNMDSASYGKGLERPVYFCTGEPQGAVKYMNRATGVASTAGKFSSAFARAAAFFRESKPDYAAMLARKAAEAFEFGLSKPGACQTAPGSAPYFYEEDNWVDDMELAAVELYNLTLDERYLMKAIEFGRQEKVTPWIGADTAKHYQWYPFVNMGHPVIVRSASAAGSTAIVRNPAINQSQAITRSPADSAAPEFVSYMRDGLELTRKKALKNPFMVGVPFIWCSNNLVTAILTQMRLYEEISGDRSYAEMEAAHRDWLFGCNPWGTSMVVGLPEGGDYPVNTHSSYVVKGEQVPGGLVDGPVYSTVFNSLKYLYLSEEDEYAAFQTKLAVYHDDFADYSTNECTMDGTACLIYYMSAMQAGKGERPGIRNAVSSRGGIVRMDTTRKEVWLAFTAHEFTDGFGHVLNTLRNYNTKASFFLTGDFCRGEGNEKIIAQLKSYGHYIGPHSDRHLLYCSWENRDSLLVTREDFTADLDGNYSALLQHGIKRENATVFMPPYEWYNDRISEWSAAAGLTLVNISSGTNTNQDWTVPGEGNKYYSSDLLIESLQAYEKKNGMNGYILLIHPGTDPRRTDKFYLRLGEVMEYLRARNYAFRNFGELI